ncbi:GL23213 [Drosophila persimilis]|uniref:GL23213 n=1 Tax=Drosophila persimilis TaxID=7234 RepID=B4G5A8_DROPE|nr:GL23213 [Drosophila persimilis]
MRVHYIVWMVPFILATCVTEINSLFEFTNIKCNSIDKKFFDFDYCHIKAVNRTFKYMSVRTTLHELPIREVLADLQILRRFKGYIPITMNVTLDVCKYMNKKKSRNPMVNFFDGVLKNYSNAYHKCPYDHDVWVEQLPTQFVNTQLSDVLPLPSGDYAFYSTWIVNGKMRGTLCVYGTLF